MKKVLPIISLMAAMTLVACGGGKKSEAAKSSSKAPTTQESAKPSSQAPSSQTPSSEAPGVHTHNWVAGTPGTNSAGKTIKNYTCTCGKVAAGIDLRDIDAASDGTFGDDGKMSLSKTFVWKIVAPKAGTVSIQMAAKLSSAYVDAAPTGIKFLDGYELKVNDAAGTLTMVGKEYEADLNFNGNTATYYEVGTATVNQGENTISLKLPGTQHYRLCHEGEVRIIF